MGGPPGFSFGHRLDDDWERNGLDLDTWDDFRGRHDADLLGGAERLDLRRILSGSRRIPVATATGEPTSLFVGERDLVVAWAAAVLSCCGMVTTSGWMVSSEIAESCTTVANSVERGIG